MLAHLPDRANYAGNMPVYFLPSSASTDPTARRGVRIIGLLVAGLLLTGCGTAAPQQPAPKPSTTAVQATPESPDPTEAPEKPEFVPVGNVEVGQGHVLLGDLDRATGVTALPNNEFLITQGETGQFRWLTQSGEVKDVTGPAADQLHKQVSDAAADIKAKTDPVEPPDAKNPDPADNATDPESPETPSIPEAPGSSEAPARPEATEDPAQTESPESSGPAKPGVTQEVAPVPGIFGVALSPDFANDSLIYAFVSTGTASKVVALGWSQGQITFERDVLTDLPAGEGRNGGALGFGPDGYLYVSVGDTGTPQLAQELTSEAGKILRVLPDGTLPGNNPLSKSAVWSLGHRNVTGLTWTDQGAMYAVEQGQSVADELNLIIPGANYGWPLVEGAGHDGTDVEGGAMSAQEALDRGFTAPALEWQWSPQKLTTADPVGIVATEEGLYIPGFNGQRLWRVGLLENGLALTQEFYTQTFGSLGAIALGQDQSLVFLTANTAPNPGAASIKPPIENSEEVPLGTRDRLIEFKVTY